MAGGSRDSRRREPCARMRRRTGAATKAGSPAGAQRMVIHRDPREQQVDRSAAEPPLPAAREPRRQ